MLGMQVLSKSSKYAGPLIHPCLFWFVCWGFGFFHFHVGPGDGKSSGLHSKHFPHCTISPALESLSLLLGKESNVICTAVGTKTQRMVG